LGRKFPDWGSKSNTFPGSFRNYQQEILKKTGGTGSLIFPPRPSIGRILAGGYAFFYEGPTVDLMGLNNTLMAHANGLKEGLKNHASFDKPTFYKLRPDFVDGDFGVVFSGILPFSIVRIIKFSSQKCPILSNLAPVK